MKKDEKGEILKEKELVLQRERERERGRGREGGESPPSFVVVVVFPVAYILLSCGLNSEVDNKMRKKTEKFERK